MSGLGNKVRLEAKNGKIIISKSTNIRDGWGSQIKALVAANGDPSKEFMNISIPSLDGLTDLPWDGLTFEEWQNDYAKLS